MAVKARRDSSTGLLNIHIRKDEEWGEFWEVDIRKKEDGRVVARKLKRFKDRELAIEWRDMQRRILRLTPAVDHIKEGLRYAW